MPSSFHAAKAVQLAPASPHDCIDVHRGPDDEGCWISAEMDPALGFRRLSIIDLETGDQPLQTGRFRAVAISAAHRPPPAQGAV